MDGNLLIQLWHWKKIKNIEMDERFLQKTISCFVKSTECFSLIPKIFLLSLKQEWKENIWYNFIKEMRLWIMQ